MLALVGAWLVVLSLVAGLLRLLTSAHRHRRRAKNAKGPRTRHSKFRWSASGKLRMTRVTKSRRKRPWL